MITNDNDTLKFSFAEVDPAASTSVSFIRTLRIPDNGETHALPPGLGSFPLRHVDDFAATLDPETLKRGGVMLPMHRSEALWLSFNSRGADAYPFAIKIAAGKINAVTGEPWREGLHADPQDYIVVPAQPWLDGFAIEPGVIRQFIAERLGEGYTAEEQLTGRAEFGGIQIIAYPMKGDVYRQIQEDERRRAAAEFRAVLNSSLDQLAAHIDQIFSRGHPLMDRAAALRNSDLDVDQLEPEIDALGSDTEAWLKDAERLQSLVGGLRAWRNEILKTRSTFSRVMEFESVFGDLYAGESRQSFNHAAMGLAPGGRMGQEIYRDLHGRDVWDLTVSSRCFVTLLPAETWRAVTGEAPPQRAPTAADYAEAGLPWFDYDAPNQEALPGSTVLAKLKSWFATKSEKAKPPPEQAVDPAVVISLGPSAPRKPTGRPGNIVREPET